MLKTLFKDCEINTRYDIEEPIVAITHNSAIAALFTSNKISVGLYRINHEEIPQGLRPSENNRCYELTDNISLTKFINDNYKKRKDFQGKCESASNQIKMDSKLLINEIKCLMQK